MLSIYLSAGVQELDAMIRGTIAAFPEQKDRNKALKAIQWRFRGPNGEYVGLKNLRCSFVPESEAMVFDGRDSVETKEPFYSVFLGKLTIEILKQSK